jgi:hypothetical protein
MKKNTGCGCNDHKACPPASACDKARTETVNCFADSDAPYSKACPATVKVPVPLAEVILEADVESHIKLPTPAREIKWIKKNISLTQCKAIPAFFPPDHGCDPGYVKVFITGVVHKNIQYVEQCSGFVRDFSVDVEFSCNERVKIFEPVQFPPNPFVDTQYPGFSVKNSVFERREITPDGLSADRCTGGALTYELFNEPIHCELLSAAINDIDLFKDFDRFGRFNKVTEKMEILLFFKLLQNQQIAQWPSKDH